MTGGTFLEVQWLRIWDSTAEGAGSIPSGGTRIPHAAWTGQTHLFKSHKWAWVCVPLEMRLGVQGRNWSSESWLIFPRSHQAHVPSIALYHVSLLRRKQESCCWSRESRSIVSDSLRPHVQSMELSRPEYWRGWPFPSPGDFSQPRDQTQVSRVAGRFFTSEPQGKPSSLQQPTKPPVTAGSLSG